MIRLDPQHHSCPRARRPVPASQEISSAPRRSSGLSLAGKGRLSLKRAGLTSIAADLARPLTLTVPAAFIPGMRPSRWPVRIDQAKWHANGAAATRGADCRCFEPNVAGLTSGLLKTGKMEGEHNGARHVRASSVGFRSGEAATEG